MILTCEGWEDVTLSLGSEGSTTGDSASRRASGNGCRETLSRLSMHSVHPLNAQIVQLREALRVLACWTMRANSYDRVGRDK